jgi:hypothetical protein
VSISPLYMRPIFKIINPYLKLDINIILKESVHIAHRIMKQKLNSSENGKGVNFHLLVHHIHAFTIYVMILILLKSVLFTRSSRLILDKTNLGFRLPCAGPRREATCQVYEFL